MKANGNGSVGPEIPLEALARELGQEVVDKAQEHVGEVIAWEKLRRKMSNQADIAPLRARYGCLFDRRKELKDILRLAPSEDLTGLRRQRWYHWAMAGVLIVGGVFFAHLALAPFGLGWEAWALSLAIGVIAAFWTDKTLEKIESEKLLQAVCVLALVGSLAGLLVMALLRGDILALYLKTATASGMPGEVQDAVYAGDFYKDAIWKLQLLMALLAVAMELGSGLALFEARRVDVTTHEQAQLAKKELHEVEGEMIAIIGSVTHLENDPVINEAQFYRDFYLGLLQRVKRNGLIHLLLVLGFILSMNFSSTAHAQANGAVSTVARDLSVVAAIDFTQSVGGKGYDGTTDYEKNIEGVCRLLSQLPPGTRITVLAITDRSFAQPYILLHREIPRDKGPLQFQDRVAIAKARIAAELRQAAKLLPPKFAQSDILGALIIGADILRHSSGRKVFVLFSDMRQFTGELDLERPKLITTAQALNAVEKHKLVADLQGIEVYALGVDGAGKSVAYWDSLRAFWVTYFQKSRGDLKAFAMTRDLDLAAPLQ